jgi:hypothetical protein
MTRIAKTTNSQSALAAPNDLRAVTQGKVLLPADPAYAAARQIWNGAVDHQPALFAVLLRAMELNPEISNRSRHAARAIFRPWAFKLVGKQRQKRDLNRARRPDRQRFGLISCIFGLNSFLNIDRSVKQ